MAKVPNKSQLHLMLPINSTLSVKRGNFISENSAILTDVRQARDILIRDLARTGILESNTYKLKK